MRRIKVFLFNGILLTITSFVMQAIGMFFTVFISGKIGTEAIGIYSLVMSVYFFATTVANSGIHLTTVRIISEQHTFSLNLGIKKAMKKCIFYSIFMASLTCLLLIIFSGLISSTWLHGKISDIPLKILAISLPFVSLSSCLNGYFAALRNVKSTVITQVFEQVLKISITFLLLTIFKPANINLTIIYLVLASTISEILSFLLLFTLFILNKNKLKGYSYSDTNYTKQILKISVPISLTSYIRSGLSTLKQILIPSRLELSGLSCEKSLSSYGIINGMAMPLIMFPCSFISSFSTLLIPEFSSMNAKKDYRGINFSLEKIFKFCFTFSFFIMGFFWCFSKELNMLFYSTHEISYYLKLLCPLIVLMYIDNIVDSILKGLDKQVLVMGINILDLSSSIFLIYFLLPIKGISGYIIVLFVSELLNGLLSFLLLLKHTHLKIDFNNWIFKPFFSIVLLNIIFTFLLSNLNYTFNIFFLMLLFFILYFVIIFLLKGLVKEDISILIKNKSESHFL